MELICNPQKKWWFWIFVPMAPGNYGSFHHLQADDVKADNCSDFHCLFHCGFHQWPIRRRGMFHRNLPDGKDPNVQSPPGACWETTNPGGFLQLIQRFESLYRRSRIIYQIGLLRSGVMMNYQPKPCTFFRGNLQIFPSYVCIKFEFPPSHGSHLSNDPCRYKCRDCSERCEVDELRSWFSHFLIWGTAPWCFGFGQKESRQIGDPRLSFSDTSRKLPAIKLCKLYGFLNNKQVCSRVYLICIRIGIGFRRTIWNSLTFGFFTWILFPSPLCHYEPLGLFAVSLLTQACADWQKIRLCVFLLAHLRKHSDQCVSPTQG